MDRKGLEERGYSKEYLDRYFPIEPSREDLKAKGYSNEFVDGYFRTLASPKPSSKSDTSDDEE
jgi:hypothetical protein